MSSLRPASISDAGLLKRLDSLSSKSGPSSPRYHVGVVQATVASVPAPTKDNTSPRPLSNTINSSQYKNNNNNVPPTFYRYLNGCDNFSSEEVNAPKRDYKNGINIICYRFISDLLILECGE